MSSIENCTITTVNVINNNFLPSNTCTKCSETKPLTEFYKCKDTKDGHHSECKKCFIKRSRKYYKENQDQLLEQKKQYFQQNKEKIRNYKREYDLNCYHNNEQYRLKNLFHKRINMALKGKDKTVRTQELIGVNIHFFKRWLESQFSPEMSWENRGVYWDIDRIIPCSAFDLTNEDEQKKCFSWTNTQTLEKIVNMKKGAKRNIELEMQHALKVNKFKEIMNTPLL